MLVNNPAQCPPISRWQPEYCPTVHVTIEHREQQTFSIEITPKLAERAVKAHALHIAKQVKVERGFGL